MQEESRAEQFFQKVRLHSADAKIRVAVYFALDSKEAVDRFEDGWTAAEARDAEMAFCEPTMEEFRKRQKEGWNLAGVLTDDCLFPLGQKFRVAMEEGLRRMHEFEKEMKQQPNYVKKLIQSVGEGVLGATPGAVGDIKVQHDDWCNIFRGGSCNCDPTFTETIGGSQDERIKRMLESAANFAETVRKKRL